METQNNSGVASFQGENKWADCPYCRDREWRNRRTKTVYIGKDGWPVTGIINAPIRTFLRRLIHTKKKMNYGDWLEQGGCKIDFS